MRTALLPVLAAASVLAGEPLVVETIRLEHESAARVAADLGKWLAPGFCAVVADERDPDGKLLLFRGRQGDLPAVREIVAGLDVVHPEIRIDALVLQIGSPTNRESAMDWYYRALLGADPALFPESDRPAVACYRGTLAAASSDGNAHLLGMPRAVFRDGCKAEVSLLDIAGEPGKPAVTNGVRLSVRPLVYRGGTPLLHLAAEASVFAGDDTAETEELGLALEPGAAAVFAPPPAGDCRVLVLLFPDDAWSRAADPATNAPAVPLDLSVRFVELTDAALSNDFFRAAFAGADSNVGEPVSDDAATFTQIFTAPQADLLLLRLTNEFGCFATFRQTQRWNGGEEAQFSFRTSVFRYRNGQESPVEERTSGFFLSVAPRLESPSPGCWSILFELGLTDVGRPSPETPAGADGVYPERPFVPVRKLATSVDVFPGSVVFFRAGDGTTRSPLVILECTPAAPLPAAPAVSPPAASAEAGADDGRESRFFVLAPDAFKFLSLATDYPPRWGAPRLDTANAVALFAALGFGEKDGCRIRFVPELPSQLFFRGSPENVRAFEEALETIGSRSLPSYEIDLESVLVPRENLPAFLEAVGAKDDLSAAFGTVLATFPSKPDFRAAVGPAAEVSRDVTVATFAGAPGSASAVTEYIYPTRYAFYAATNGVGGAGADPVHVEPRAFTTRTVGTTFEARPLPAEEDGAVPLFVRIERRGVPTWFNQIPELPVRGADGTVERVKTFLEQPLFPERTVAATLRLKPGAVALLQGAPDFEDGSRIRFPAVTLVPVENFRRAEPEPAPDSGDAEARRLARRLAVMRGKSDAAASPPARDADETH